MVPSIEHVVVVMMENRSFDEYFGTFPSANGILVPSPPLTQPWPSQLSGTLAPYRMSSFTSDAPGAGGLGHDWGTMHEAIGWPGIPDNGSFYVPNHEPIVMGYFVENDLPYHWALARTFALCDNYFCSALAGTFTNRMYLVGGSIDSFAPTSENGTVYMYGQAQGNWFGGGAPPPPVQDQGPVIFNISGTPGGDPVVQVPWGSYLSDLHNSGKIANGEISYRVYDDWHWLPPLTDKAQTLGASTNNNLNVFLYYSDPYGKQGDAYYVESVASGSSNPAIPLQFELDAAAGQLPTVAWIYPPYCLCEHPPFTPPDGAVYLSRIVDAVLSSPQWLSTLLVITWDETDTHFDHVVPPLSPDPRPTAAAPLGPGEAYEPWVDDSANSYPDSPIGAGMRVPCIIVSPWTYHQGVISEVMDHTSILRLMENVTGVPSTTLPQNTGINSNLGWRRYQFENLNDVISSLNSPAVASTDIDRSLATGLPTQATAAAWQSTMWNRLSQLAGSAPSPPTASQAPLTQACSLNVTISAYDYHEVMTMAAGSGGTATFPGALTVEVVGFEPTELTAPDDQALGQLVQVNTPDGPRWLRAPQISIVDVPLLGDLSFACTGVNADPHGITTEPGVSYPFVFTYAAAFSTPTETFNFPGGIRAVELMAAFEVDATVVSFGQILLFGGTMPPQPVSGYATVVDQLSNHADNVYMPIDAVHTPKVLMTAVTATTFPVDNPQVDSVTYTNYFECTGTAQFNYFNNGSGDLEWAYLQFDLPDGLADLAQPYQEAVQVPPGQPPSTLLTPAPLVFLHPGFPVPQDAPADAMYVLDRFTTVVTPVSVSAKRTPLAWATDWSAAHYNGETGRVALTVQLALQGGNDSGSVFLLRVAYRVSFLAYARKPR